ncbi:MAG: molybdopterin-dependent oxidoreductase [Acidimicrobiia bacterium]|nr:molybdopterin-dependent oxidoreductase [Acidimicrobiia bacterium]
MAEPSSADPRTAEGQYRSRWNWDSWAFGTHCVDCYPGNCLYRVYVRDGRVWREEPAATHATIEEGVPDFNPMGCNKGAAWSQQLYEGDRLLHPLKRAGERGEGRWERISWDEACTMVADAMLDAIEAGGPEDIAREGTPEIATVAPTERFFNTIGGRAMDLHASFNDFSIGLHETFGKFCPVSSGDDWFKSELILIWHMNPAFTRIPLYHFMLEARYRGAEIVSISPDLNASHMHADYHVPMPSGNDVPFGLAMVQTILAEGIEDTTFIREQTDLPLLVRTDTRRFLRQTDVEGPGDGVREDQLYHWDPDHGLVKADRGNLMLHGRPVALEGSYRVTLHDGTEVEVEPVMARLRRMLDERYTPELQQEITGVHPDLVRTIARKAAAKKTNIMLGWNSCKYYHGDLIERTMCLLLAVTGNWGKFGTGIRSWTAGTLDGQGMLMAKDRPGVEATDAILQARDGAIAAIQANDLSITTEELAAKEMQMALRMALGGDGEPGRMAAPGVEAFWWYWHVGYQERWNTKGWGDDSLPRTFDEYFNEALEAGWWSGLDVPRPEHPPKVLIECGGNMLRRTRGGKTTVLEHLWPKLDFVVSIDFRINATGLWSDLLLPAAQHYEKLSYHIPTPHQMMLTFSDKAAEPAGEAKSEWEIYQLICKKFSERAEARGIETYKNRRGVEFDALDAWERYTLGGKIVTEEQMADEIARDAAYIGVIPDHVTLDTMRDVGHVRITNWGLSMFSLAQASPVEKDRTHTPFRNHVELGDPFPTYSRRAQFYIDHPWWLEAGEELPVHKPNPKAGGDHPLRMTSGHNRWSIHSMNMANPVILQTHRGEPVMEVNPDDAAARGVQDDDLVRVWNDIASFVTRVKVAPGVMPGQVISYNGWDPHQYRDSMGANELEAGMVKWIAFAGGYGHINYTMAEWQPIPTDRGVPCDFERYDGE